MTQIEATDVYLGEGFYITPIEPIESSHCQHTGCHDVATFVVWQDVDYVAQEYLCCAAHAQEQLDTANYPGD